MASASSAGIEDQNTDGCDDDMFAAVESGDVDYVQDLIANGASVNDTDDDGLTPLMRASLLGYPDIVEVLLHAGAHVNKLHAETTPLLLAAGISSFQIAKFYFQRVSQGGRYKSDRSMDKELAVFLNNKTKIIKTLLRAGADANVRGRCGRNALIHVTESDPEKCFVSVFESGITDSFMLMMDKELAERCECLLSQDEFKGIDTPDVKGRTALMCAAGNKLVKCCETLLKHKADVNAVDTEGRPALVYAALRGARECCLLLLDKGGDYKVRKDKKVMSMVHDIIDQSDC